MNTTIKEKNGNINLTDDEYELLKADLAGMIVAKSNSVVQKSIGKYVCNLEKRIIVVAYNDRKKTLKKYKKSLLW